MADAMSQMKPAAPRPPAFAWEREKNQLMSMGLGNGDENYLMATLLSSNGDLELAVTMLLSAAENPTLPFPEPAPQTLPPPPSPPREIPAAAAPVSAVQTGLADKVVIKEKSVPTEEQVREVLALFAEFGARGIQGVAFKTLYASRYGKKLTFSYPMTQSRWLVSFPGVKVRSDEHKLPVFYVHAAASGTTALVPASGARKRGPANAEVVAAAADGAREGDWRCPTCAETNFGWRKDCVYCVVPLTPHDELPEYLHFMRTFKTKKCSIIPAGKHNFESCKFWHHEGDRRRDPYGVVTYSTKLCDSKNSGGQYNASNVCLAGDACAAAHNVFEIAFHPQRYKKTKCKNGFASCCKYTFCGFTHPGEVSRATDGEHKEAAPTKVGMSVPPSPAHGVRRPMPQVAPPQAWGSTSSTAWSKLDVDGDDAAVAAADAEARAVSDRAVVERAQRAQAQARAQQAADAAAATAAAAAQQREEAAQLRDEKLRVQRAHAAAALAAKAAADSERAARERTAALAKAQAQTQALMKTAVRTPQPAPAAPVAARAAPAVPHVPHAQGGDDEADEEDEDSDDDDDLPAMTMARPTPSNGDGNGNGAAAPTPTPPTEYMCKLSKKLMVDPVIAADGESYERAQIDAWINGEHKKATGKRKGDGVPSPVTGELLEHIHLIPNQLMKNFINDWLEKHAPRSV